MKKKEIMKLIHGEMDSYKHDLVIRFMSEKATAQAYSYLNDHIKELKLKGDDAEKLQWVNSQAEKLSSKALDEFIRHSNIAYGLKLALYGLCDKFTLEVYGDYSSFIVDPNTIEIEPYSDVADYGVSILDDRNKAFSKLRKKYLELADKISKAKADMDNAKDDGVVAEITTPDSKSHTPEGWCSFEELIQNVNAEDSSDEAPEEEAPEEVLTEETPDEEEESDE